MNTGDDSTFDDTDGSNFPGGGGGGNTDDTVESSVGSDSYYYHHSGSNNPNNNNNNPHPNESMMSSPYYYGVNQDQDHYTTTRSSTRMTMTTGPDPDASEIVHEMYLALLYLLSNPEEFQKALQAHPPRGATTLDQWNAELEDDADNDEDYESVMTATTTTPLPFIVFADDAEVVLPQAHTASQLFGIEKVEGIELEAAAGIPALSQLFLRWLALMPSGDHLNIIDPPGLTVMRIAGGRYRVTAAHRVVWTWMNEFASLSFEEGVGGGSQSTIRETTTTTTTTSAALQMGDLVTLTIVDVFETDNQGKLLSYCPTFDNKKIKKTHPASETIRKSSQKFFSMMGNAQRAVAKSEVNKRATAQFQKMGLMQHAKIVAENVKHRVEEAVHQMHSPNKSKKGNNQNNNDNNNNNNGTGTGTIADDGAITMDLKEFSQALSAAAEQATAPSINNNNNNNNHNVIDSNTSAASMPDSDTPTNASVRGDMYLSEVSTDVEEPTTRTTTGGGGGAGTTAEV